MRRIIFLVSMFFVLACAPTFAVSPELFHDQLSNVQDLALRKTLSNSIAVGLITNKVELDKAITRAEEARNNQNPIHYSARSHHSHHSNNGSSSNSNYAKMKQEITKIASKIKDLDKDHMTVVKEAGFKAQKLFENLKGKVPVSYTNTYALTQLFNPKHGTNDAPRLNKQIDAYLASIANDPVIKYALKSTNSTMQDLKKNWFGAGLGFEHVVCGELKGSKVSGYHWWYKFYRDERKDDAQVIKVLSDAGDPHVFTGQFTWDPDGDQGPLHRALKKKGGFAVGNSVQAILALGHIAMQTAKKYGNGRAPASLKFTASINGEDFTWQMYVVGNSIRSLYPMGKKGSKLFEQENYYDLEEDSALALVKGNNTVH